MCIVLEILISGRGSNMTAILKAVQSGKIKCHSCRISNKPDAPKLDFGVPTSFQVVGLSDMLDQVVRLLFPVL